jgi:tripartite-type tricarboxylate transporter receptor subunit TctC
MRCCPFYVAIIAIALPVGSALAQDTVAQFYRSRQITVIVGSSAGGGYDIYARLLAHHVPKHIPGNPSVVVVNMAGAGSNTAAAHLFNVAPNDGTYIGALQNSAVMDALFDTLLGNARRLRHDVTKFIHLGSATIDHYVCIARSDAPVKTFRDTLTRSLVLGPAVSMVSIGPQGHHDHPPRDPCPLASGRLPSVLALEISLSWTIRRPYERLAGTGWAVIGGQHQRLAPG